MTITIILTLISAYFLPASFWLGLGLFVISSPLEMRLPWIHWILSICWMGILVKIIFDLLGVLIMEVL